MGKNLLSAYELANQRIIVSNYGEQRKKLDLLERKRNQELDSLAYLDEIEEDEKTIFVEENATKFITKSNEVLTNTTQSNIIMQNKETVSFSDKPMELHWYGHFTSYSGFSRMNRAFAFGLSNKNVKVKLDIQEGNIDLNESTMSEIRRMANNDISPSATKIYGATVPLRLAHGGPKILYTMMETSNTLHEGYVDRINLYDEIWVPTHEAKDLFKENGVRPHIEVMPLGVDETRYNENVKPLNFDFPLNSFVFLSVFKWGLRKGYDLLLKAYLEEFSPDDNVSLLMVSRTDVNHNPDKIKQDFLQARNAVSKPDAELPHIALYDKPIKEKDMPKLYRAGDAFVMPSRGEGFSLPLVEAGASGLPLITTYCSGQREFLLKDSSFLIEPEGYSKASINGNLSNLAKHCGFYEDQLFPNFGRNSIEKLKEHMRYVYENQEEAKKISKKQTQHIRENYTWEKAVERVYNRLKERGTI